MTFTKGIATGGKNNLERRDRSAIFLVMKFSRLLFLSNGIGALAISDAHTVPTNQLQGKSEPVRFAYVPGDENGNPVFNVPFDAETESIVTLKLDAAIENGVEIFQTNTSSNRRIFRDSVGANVLTGTSSSKSVADPADLAVEACNGELTAEAGGAPLTLDLSFADGYSGLTFELRDNNGQPIQMANSVSEVASILGATNNNGVLNLGYVAEKEVSGAVLYEVEETGQMLGNAQPGGYQPRNEIAVGAIVFDQVSGRGFVAPALPNLPVGASRQAAAGRDPEVAGDQIGE